MRYALIVFLVVCLPEVFILRIPPEHHLQPLYPIMDTFPWYTGEGIRYEIKVDGRPHNPHDGMVDDSPGEILLPGNLPVLAGVIKYIHIFIVRIWEGEGEHHLLELQQILLGPKVMPPDVPILLHLSGLSFLIGSSQIVHSHNLLIDMSYSLWHSSIIGHHTGHLSGPLKSSPLAMTRCPELPKLHF